MQSGAAGVIVGSALVKIINEHIDDKPAMLKALAAAASELKAATRA